MSSWQTSILKEGPIVIKNKKLVNYEPVVTLLLKSLFVLLKLRQKSTWHTLLLIIILRAAQ